MTSRGFGAPPQGVNAQPLAFPRMAIEEMMEDMALFRHPITRETIRAPTPESVHAIFAFFIEKVYKQTDDDLRQLSFGCLDGVEYPELLDEAIPVILFLRSCQKLFHAAEYHYFRMHDLTHPTAARFHIQLSALINFAKFREGRVEIFDGMAADAHELREERARLIAESDSLDEKIREIERIRAEEEPTVATKQVVVTELSAELTELHAKQAQLTDDTKGIKAELQATVEKISSLKFSHLAASQELESLRASIVSSPDRVKAEMTESTERVETEKENLQATQSKIYDFQIRADSMAKAALDVASAYKLVEEALVDMDNVKALEQRVKEVRARIRDYEAERESIAASSTHIERQIKSVEQRLVRVRQQRVELSNEARDVDCRLSEQEREADREIEAAERAISDNKCRAGDISRQMQNTVHEFEADISGVAKKLNIVEKNLKDLYSSVSQATEMVATDNRSALSELQRVIDNSVRR
jgi:kinetochore protein Nuf2